MSNLKFKVMNKLKNRVTLIGNLGHDPEMRTLESGKKIAKFTVATSDTFKNGEGQKITETTWHNIVVWNALADFASKYLKKGGQICLEGRISYRSYEDKTGVTKYITEIVANELLPLSRAKSEA